MVTRQHQLTTDTLHWLRLLLIKIGLGYFSFFPFLFSSRSKFVSPPPSHFSFIPLDLFDTLLSLLLLLALSLSLSALLVPAGNKLSPQQQQQFPSSKQAAEAKSSFLFLREKRRKLLDEKRSFSSSFSPNPILRAAVFPACWRTTRPPIRPSALSAAVAAGFVASFIYKAAGEAWREEEEEEDGSSNIYEHLSLLALLKNLPCPACLYLCLPCSSSFLLSLSFFRRRRRRQQQQQQRAFNSYFPDSVSNGWYLLLARFLPAAAACNGAGDIPEFVERQRKKEKALFCDHAFLPLQITETEKKGPRSFSFSPL
jgi:hypothetical protein